MLIARDSKLVYAYTMGNFSDADPQPPQAIHPVLFWKVPARADFVRSEHLVGTTITAYTCTQGTANYVRTGFDSQSASGSYAGCSASFEREHKERVARSSLDKTLQMIGSWYNPRATLTLDECTAVSPYFVDAVEKAVASATPTRDLQAVFDEYGIAVPRQVTLGGQLYFVHAQDVHVQVDEKSVQETISAAVSVEVGGAKGTVSASFQTATSEKVTAQSIHDSSTFIACGGKVTLRTNPDKWLDTVNKASLWAVIGRAGLRSVLDLLEPDQPDLRKRALKVWDKMPPAIGAIGDLPVQNQTLPEPTTAGFLMAARDAGHGLYGGIKLVCAKDEDPPADPARVEGGASVYRNHDADIWFDCSSVCLPVPLGYSYYTEKWDTGGNPDTRFAFAQTKLSFGDWQPLNFNNNKANRAESDGFLFASMHIGNLGPRGAVVVLFGGIEMAGASAHYYTDRNNWIDYASLCLPVPKGTNFTISLRPTWGNPEVKVWWLPITSADWRLAKAKKRTVNSKMKAKNDGILHAMISVNDPSRGFLRLYVADDLAAPNKPAASASVHYYEPHDRWITHASAMLPVQSGSPYRVGHEITHGAPTVSAWWTGIIPA